MPTVVQDMPFFPHDTTVLVDGTVVFVRPYQIVLWVSIALPGEVSPPATARPFPAILDTGHNHNFVITPTQLLRWAGIDWRSLWLVPGVEPKYHAVPVPHRNANLWLFPNRPGERDALDLLAGAALLELEGGLAVIGDGVQVGVAATTRLPTYRLPVLGLRALATNRCVVGIDTARMMVRLDVP